MTEVEIRERLVAALEADLVGPFEPDAADGTANGATRAREVLPLPPSRWYLTGFLAPQADRKPDADDEPEGELATGGHSQADDAGADEPEPKRPVRFPASLGLSVLLPGAGAGGDDEDDEIRVEVRYADYVKVEVAEDHEERTRTGWERVPRGPITVRVPLDREVLEGAGVPVPGDGPDPAPDAGPGSEIPSTGLVLRGELRATDMDGLPAGARILSLFLVNQRPPRRLDRDLGFVFQVRLVLRFGPGFLDRPNRRGETGNDHDQQVLALQFRNRAEWAVGHNTSVVAPVADADGAVRTLVTTQLPRHEVPVVKHRELDSVTTDMATLAQLDGAGLERALVPLVEEYEQWLDAQRDERLDRDTLEKTRDGLMHEASRASARIRAGIDLLVRDSEVREAFQLANQAMYVAALQADQAREDRRYTGGVKPAWRPFQLAFVLLGLPALADPTHPDRAVADLIYFPTGGGKTEAYLGLIAFTLLLRRLRGKGRPDQGRGVAVILRYTLRLLTLDQLGRAATLMCALEELRRREPKRLGNARFTVGLWVGQSATANRLAEVHQALHDFTPGQHDSPFPLTRCPWCTHALDIRNIKLVDDAGKPSKTQYTRAVVYCDGPKCSFSERVRPGQGLPVLFVDEQIYQEVPDFLVATVDKFAMMPWRGEAGMIFGRATHIDEQRAYGVMHAVPGKAQVLPEGLRPPELIVQDELHLISGPLGTMVGLYEAAVDYLCERRSDGDGATHGPKVVCSTATVRRAREQIRALFGRDMALFPPRGIDDGDSFFAAPDHTRPGRLYVGVGAPGRALRAVSVRTYATLLAAARRWFDPAGPAEQPADPYMTLIGYFNSLRELGGMRRLVEDEVRNRVARFAEDKRPHHVVGPHPWAEDRALEMPAELTSRESTEEVKRTKQRLGARMAQREHEPLDVVLASSMISVGLDVDRLGLMVVTGQPKTTSEYIQATSRVGRAYPGLVVTCLNVMRPRDRSHYERFVAYHESFYREVEATSVTPFSNQALDRGLVGAFLSMVRHGIPDMESPTGVMAIHQHRPVVERILEWLVERARTHREWHDTQAEERMAHYVRKRGRNFLDAWERVIDQARKGAAGRIYSDYDRAREQGLRLLYTATDERPPDLDARQFEAPTSMRDVEPGVHVWLRLKQLDERI